jgi:hypothetical protein
MQKKQISVAHGHRWGEWQFDERRLYLDYLPHDYNVSLPTQNLVNQVFGCLRQVAAKTWGTKQVLFDLIQAYSEIFSCNSKFSKPFQSEIATRKSAWDQFLADVKALVKEEGIDRPSWNRKLDEAFNRFKVG